MDTSGNPLITSAPRSGGDVLHTRDPRRWWALALLCGAFFMVLLDGTIVLVALPSIGADLGFSEQGLQWVLSASRPSRFPSRATKEQTVRRVMVRFKVRADQAATNEQVGGCDHPRAERNQR